MAAYKSHKWKRRDGKVRCVKCRKWLPEAEIVSRSARPVCLECCRACFTTRHDDPTEEEIARICLEIQASWSEQTRLFRAGLILAPWEAPEFLIRKPGRRFKDGGKTRE